MPKPDDPAKAVSDKYTKYIVVRRLEFKRLQNPEAIQNLRIVKEKDGIMILEKYGVKFSIIPSIFANCLPGSM